MTGIYNLVRRIPPQWRALGYDIFVAGAFLWSLWQASKGDWADFAAALIVAVGAIVPRGNVDIPPGPVDTEPQDDAL